MCQLVFLVIAVLECDKDPQVVCACYHPNAGARKFSTELIEASRTYTLFGTIDVEGRDRWMVRSLFSEVRDLDNPILAGKTRRTARGRRVRVMFQGRGCVLDLPVTLSQLADSFRGTKVRIENLP